MQTAYKEITINRHHAGFGMYQIGEANGEAWANEADILLEISGNGIEFLPLDEAIADPRYLAAGVEDIRGKIYGGDPAEIFASIGADGDIGYFGIIECQVADNYWAA